MLLTEEIDHYAAGLLRDKGYEVEVAAGPLREDELIRVLDGVGLLGIGPETPVTKRVLMASDLHAVGVFGADVSHVDLEAHTPRNAG